MKRNLVALLVAGLGSAFSAHADGNFGETVAVNGTDVWALSCPIGTVSARARVNDGILAGNVISVQVINPHGSAATQSAVDGGTVSPDAILVSGAGLYLVNVSSSTVLGLEGYSISLDCRDVFGVDIAGDQSELIQDQ